MRVQKKTKAFAYRVPIRDYNHLQCGYALLNRSALKRTPVQDSNSFSLVLYHIISTTYQKIRDLSILLCSYLWIFAQCVYYVFHSLFLQKGLQRNCKIKKLAEPVF